VVRRVGSSKPLEAIEKQSDLEHLFRDAAEDLARYFTRRHGNADTSRDLVQETFMEMAKGLDQGRQPRSPRGYLFGIARRVSQAAWRGRERERAYVDEERSPESAAAPARDERVEAAYEAIAALSPVHREILDHRFIQDLSYAEIAEALNLPVGTVRSRLHHAVAAVRQRLADDDSAALSPPDPS